MPFPAGANFAAEHIPGGGFGGFHVGYVPQTGVLTITVRVTLTWQADQGVWDPAKQQSFRGKLGRRVPRGWNRKWRFRCTAPGFPNVADPVFVLQVSAANPHFEFVCHNVHGQAYLHASQNKVHLFAHDVDSIDAQGGPKTFGMSAGGIMTYERRKIEQILGPVQNITVSRATGPWVVAPASAPALIAFAQDLARVDPAAPNYPLIIEATSGLRDKARDMVHAVATFIRYAGVNNYPITESPIKTSRKFKNIFTHTPKPTGTVTIRLDDDDVATRQAWRYRYKVAVHEFGHILGLPDEYLDNYPGLGTQAHDNWRQLCLQVAATLSPGRRSLPPGPALRLKHHVLRLADLRLPLRHSMACARPADARARGAHGLGHRTRQAGGRTVNCDRLFSREFEWYRARPLAGPRQ